MTELGVHLIPVRASEASGVGAMCILISYHTQFPTSSSTATVVKVPLMPLNKVQSTTRLTHLVGLGLASPEPAGSPKIHSHHRTPDRHEPIIRPSVSARTNRQNRQKRRPLAQKIARDVTMIWPNVQSANLFLVATYVVRRPGVLPELGLPREYLCKPPRIHLLPSSI